ncbi:hypothetical protein [Luteibacter yeojuensis]
MRFIFPPVRRSRNPLVRALSLVLGLAVVGVLLVFGVVVLGVLMVGGLVFLAVRQWKLGQGRVPPSQPSPAKDQDVLEGEFVVIRQNTPIHH